MTLPDLGDPDPLRVRGILRYNVTQAPGHSLAAIQQDRDHGISLSRHRGHMAESSVHVGPFDKWCTSSQCRHAHCDGAEFPAAEAHIKPPARGATSLTIFAIEQGRYCLVPRTQNDGRLSCTTNSPSRASKLPPA